MPLDEATSAFLDRSRNGGGPAPGEMPLDEFRAAVEPFRALGFEREDVAAVHDLRIPAGNGPDVHARLYLPHSDEPPPVLVWAHGGSWVRVTVDLLDGHFRVLANRSGCAVLAVDYRLAPEAKFPAPVDDVLAALDWIHRTGGDARVDSSRIAVGGESSGANIAAGAALRDAGGTSPRRLRHQILVVPLLDATFSSPSWEELGRDYLLTREQLNWALGQYAPDTDPKDPLLSPLHADSLAGLPPTVLIGGEYDPLRDDARGYAERLRSAGVPVEHIEQPGLIHHALLAPGLLPTGRECVERAAAAVGNALHGRDRNVHP